MHQNLQKVLNLAKKTGDKLIVLDSAKPDNIYVVMPFEEYEKMTIGRNEVRGLTEDELLDKINRDIAIWKSEQKIDPSYGKASEGRLSYAKAEDKSEDEYERASGEHEKVDYLDGLESDSPCAKISEGKDCDNDNYDEDESSCAEASEDRDDYEPGEKKPGMVKKVKNHWRIPESRKKAAEEIIEEDRQYLEEIHY